LNNSTKVQPIKLKFGIYVVHLLPFFSKKSLSNLVTRLMRYGSAKTTPGFSMNCAAGKNVGRFCFLNNSTKVQPIKLKFGSHVVHPLPFFSKKHLSNLVTWLMRNDPTKTTPGFDCNACDLYGELQSEKKLVCANHMKSQESHEITINQAET
jgi:hypothetical protein